jgi:hypothetical protein
MALLLTVSLVGAAPVAAVQPPGPADPAVITNWNGIAVATIPANPAAFLNYAFVHLAIYNAVVGITHEYELYKWDVDGRARPHLKPPLRSLLTACSGRISVEQPRILTRSWLPPSRPCRTESQRTKGSATAFWPPIGSSLSVPTMAAGRR